MNNLKVSLDGPYYIPPASEMVESNNGMRRALAERQEYETFMALRNEMVSTMRANLLGTIAETRAVLLGTIATELDKLTQAVAIGKATGRRQSLAGIATSLKDLLTYCGNDENLEELLASVESISSHLGTKKVDEDQLNQALEKLTTALDTSKIERRLDPDIGEVGNILRGAIRPSISE